jgi:hypothetical protein
MEGACSVSNLAEAYVTEQQRCRELLGVYRDLPNGVGTFGAIMIEDMLRRADRAVMDGDTVAMLSLYAEMQGTQ